MKPHVRAALISEMLALERLAALGDGPMACRQAGLIKRISTRRRVRLPPELRMMFCKRCKSFMAPGRGSRVRIGRSPVRAVRVTCLLCGHTYRHMLPKS